MNLMVNGEPRQTGAMTLEGLIEELGLKPGSMAAEVNLRVISRKEHASFILSEGDRVELISFVGGG